MLQSKSARQTILLSCLVLLCPLANAQSYRILITNDDGIQSPLLAVLKETLEALPGVEVMVSAPHENQSGSSNSSIGSPLTVDRIYVDDVLFGYAVHGKPADAVTFGLNHLGVDQPFDLVVSGINLGPNVGSVSHGSGTVGAAMRAQFLGYPSIAISQETSGVDTVATAQFAARIVDKYRRDGAPEGIVLSINIPRGEIKGVRVSPMGDSYLGRDPYQVISEEGNTTEYEATRIRLQSETPDTDTYSFQNGYITVTPLKFDWTAYAFIDELKSWNLQ